MNPHRPSPDPPERFARRFRLLMSYHDLTLADIARATRSAVSTVGTWRNGRVPSSPIVIEELAKIFHVRVEYLLTGWAQTPYPAFDRLQVQEAAGRIMEDLEALMRALGGDGVQPGAGPQTRHRRS